MKNFALKTYLILITFIPIIYFIILQQDVINTITKVENQFTYISWAITAITSMLAFGILYLTILLDRNVFKVVQSTIEFFNPYHLEKKDIKNYIYDRHIANVKSGIIFFFFIFSIITLFINLFWVICISHYSDYKLFKVKYIISLHWLKEIDVMSDILAVMVPMAFWLLSTIINIALFAIIVERKEIFKVSIPKGMERLNISYLHEKQADLSELLFKAGPLLYIFFKYENKTKTIDFYMEQDIPWYDYHAVYTFYSNDKIAYKLYFKSNTELKSIKPQVFSIDTRKNKDFEQYLLESSDLVDVTFYTREGIGVAKFKLSKTEEFDYKIYKPYRKIVFDEDSIETSRLILMNSHFDIEKNDL